MKKLLLITSTYVAFDKPFRKAFESLDWSIQAVDYWGNKILQPGNILHRAVNKLPNTLKLKIVDLAQWHIDYKIIAKAKSFKPDLIFMIKAKKIHTSTLLELSKIAPTANYYPETFNHWNSIRRIAHNTNYFFNCEPEIVRKLNEMRYGNAYYLPFSADIDPNATFSRNPKKYDISFVGSFNPVLYAHRETILKQVKDAGLNVWGNKAWLDTSLKDCYRGRPRDEEMFKIYNESKIVVNIDLLKGIGGIEGIGVNLRPFEVTSCGAMLLNHDDRRDIFNLFEDGKEFISFKGSEDIKQKVEYYLNHEEERLKIAEAGFNRVKNDHTHVKRIGEIIKTIGA